jgi:hypothetical protein
MQSENLVDVNSLIDEQPSKTVDVNSLIEQPQKKNSLQPSPASSVNSVQSTSPSVPQSKSVESNPPVDNKPIITTDWNSFGKDADNFVLTHDGVKIPLNNTVVPKDAIPSLVTNLQQKINTKSATQDDINIIAQASGKKPTVVQAYIKDGAVKGAAIENNDYVDEQRQKVSDYISSYNRINGTQYDPQEVMSSADKLNDFLNASKKENTRLSKEVRIGGKLDLSKPLTPKQSEQFAFLNYGVVPIRNEMINQIVQKTVQELPKDKAIDKIASVLNPTDYQKVKDMQKEGWGIKDFLTTAPTPLSVFKSDYKEQGELFNYQKGIAELKYNDALRQNALNKISKGTVDGNEELINEGHSDLSNVDENVISKYPALQKQRIAQEVNDYIAKKSGVVKGYDAETFNDYKEKVFGSSTQDRLDAMRALGILDDPKQKDIAESMASNSTYFANNSILGGAVPSFLQPIGELGYSIGDITGLRSKSDVFADKIKDQLFPKDFTGNNPNDPNQLQLKSVVQHSKTAVNTTFNLAGMMAIATVTEGVGTELGVSRSVAQKLGAYTSFGLPAFDESLKNHPESITSEPAKYLYAAINSIANAEGGRVLDLGKITRIPGVSEVFAEAANKISNKSITEQGLRELLNSGKAKYVDFAMKYGKNVTKGAATMAYFTTANNVVRMAFGDKDAEANLLPQAGHAFVDGLLGMSVMGAFGAVSDMRREKNTTFKNNIYNLALNHDAAADILKMGLDNGMYTKPQYDEKMQILNTARAAKNSLDAATIETGINLDANQKAVYVANKTAQKVFENKAAQEGIPEATKNKYLEQAKRLSEQSTQTLDGLKYTPTLQPLYELYNAEKEFDAAKENYNPADKASSDALESAKSVYDKLYSDYLADNSAMPIKEDNVKNEATSTSNNVSVIKPKTQEEIDNQIPTVTIAPKENTPETKQGASVILPQTVKRGQEMPTVTVGGKTNENATEKSVEISQPTEAASTTNEAANKVEQPTNTNEGFQKAGEKGKQEQDPSHLGNWIVDNAQTGDKIKINNDEYYEVKRTKNKRGYTEVELQHYFKNDNGEFENNPSGIKILSDKNRGTEFEKLGTKDASDLFQSSYTDKNGNKVVETASYIPKEGKVEQATEESLVNQAKDLVNSGVVKGFTAETLKESANNNPTEFQQHLKDISEQANDPKSNKATVDTYGKELVDIAQKLNPVESKPSDSNMPELLGDESQKPVEGLPEGFGEVGINKDREGDYYSYFVVHQDLGRSGRNETHGSLGGPYDTYEEARRDGERLMRRKYLKQNPQARLPESVSKENTPTITDVKQNDQNTSTTTKVSKPKLAVEPSKPISEMNSEEMYDYATKVKKELAKQDKEFAGKTEAEKEAGGYYDVVDNVGELRDASTKINFIENSEGLNDLSSSVRSALGNIKDKPSEYDLAILNAAKKKAVELNIPTEDLIKEVIKKEGNRYKDANDAEFMMRNALEKINQPNDQNTTTPTAVSSPISENKTEPQRQGNEGNVSENTRPAKRGNAETSTTVLEGKEKPISVNEGEQRGLSKPFVDINKEPIKDIKGIESDFLTKTKQEVEKRYKDVDSNFRASSVRAHEFWVEQGVENGYYKNAIVDGKITVDNAKKIIESAGLEVPKNILEKADSVTPTEVNKKIKRNEQNKTNAPSVNDVASDNIIKPEKQSRKTDNERTNESVLGRNENATVLESSNNRKQSATNQPKVEQPSTIIEDKQEAPKEKPISKPISELPKEGDIVDFGEGNEKVVRIVDTKQNGKMIESVNQDNGSNRRNLYTMKDYQRALDNKEKYKKLREDRVVSAKESEESAKKKAAKEAADKNDAQNTYGFADNESSLQKGKILAYLNKDFGTGRGRVKDFIKSIVLKNDARIKDFNGKPTIMFKKDGHELIADNRYQTKIAREYLQHLKSLPENEIGVKESVPDAVKAPIATLIGEGKMKVIKDNGKNVAVEYDNGVIEILPKAKYEQKLEAEKNSKPTNNKESNFSKKLKDKYKDFNLGGTKDADLSRSGRREITLPDGTKETVKPVAPEIVNGFYSPIEKKILTTKDKSLSANKWRERFGKGDEAKFTGILDFLNSKKPNEQVSKQEVLDYIKNNRIQLVEVVKGKNSTNSKQIETLRANMQDLRSEWDELKSKVDNYRKGEEDVPQSIVDRAKQVSNSITKTDAQIMELESGDNTKYSGYQLAGDKANYREVLITMPSRSTEVAQGNIDSFKQSMRDKYGNGWRNQMSASESKSFDALANGENKTAPEFKSSHFSEPNIIAHARMSIRDGVDEGGKKVKTLMVEEFQSDAGQGKKKGTVEFEAPFISDTNQWTKLLWKYALRHAVEEGADRIAWTTGEQQNSRYDLSKQVDSIQYFDRGKEGYSIMAWKDGELLHDQIVAKDKLEATLGKEVANKIINNEGENGIGGGKTLKGDDLKVGGSGMKGFYGEPSEGKIGIVGNVAKGLVKELTGKEGKIVDTKIDQQHVARKNADKFAGMESTPELSTQHSIEITPELKAAVEGGLPLLDKSKIRTDNGTQTIDEYVAKGKAVLNKLFPDATFEAYKTHEEFEKAGGVEDSRGTAITEADGSKRILLNLAQMKEDGVGKTAFHEVIHPIVAEVFGKTPEELAPIWNEIASTMKDAKGMDKVWEHLVWYSEHKTPVEGITEFLTQVADGNIKVEDIPAAKQSKIVDLINKLFEKLGINFKIEHPLDLQKFANDIKTAFETGDVESLKNTIDSRSSENRNASENANKINTLLFGKDADFGLSKGNIKEAVGKSIETVRKMIDKGAELKDAIAKESDNFIKNIKSFDGIKDLKPTFEKTLRDNFEKEALNRFNKESQDRASQDRASQVESMVKDAMDEGFETLNDIKDAITNGLGIDTPAFRKMIDDAYERVKSEPESEGIVNIPSRTGITHAATAELREKYGLGNYVRDEAMTDAELQKKADDIIAEGYNPNDLVGQMENGIPPTPVENFILKRYVAELVSKYNKSRSLEDFNDLDRVMKAVETIGTLQSHSFRTRGGLVDISETLPGFLRTEVELNKNAPLTEGQKKKVEQEYDNIQTANADYEAKIAALEAENAALKEVKNRKANKKSSTRKTHEDFVKERQDAVAGAREALRKLRTGESGLSSVPLPGVRELVAIAPHVKKALASLVEEGSYKLADYVKELHGQFKDVLEGITEKDINNIIAGKYDEKKATRSELAARMVDLKTEANLVNRLEDLLKGEEPKDEKRKIKRNQAIESLRSKIKQAETFKRGYEKEVEQGKKEPIPDELKRLRAVKLGIERNLRKVQEDIDNGNFSPAQKATSILDNPEVRKQFPEEYKATIEAKDKLIKAKNERHLRLLRQQQENMSDREKAIKGVAEVLNIPRALMTMLDYSAMLRQAVIPTIAHPSLAGKSLVEMIKVGASQKRYDRWFYDLVETPRYKLMELSKLAITDSTSPLLTAREESFMSNLAEKIPVIGKTLNVGKVKIPGTNLVKGSERAYTMYLNKMRVDLFNRFADDMEGRGLTFENSPKAYKEMANYVNNSTGRGDLGAKLDRVAPILNSLFFSPRLIASRMNMLTYLAQPRFYREVPKEVRVAYFKDMTKFVGLGLTVLGLFSINKDDNTTVEIDPRSSDFGKVKNKNTRWDIWGGFQQYVRLFSQMATGERKSTTGKIYTLDGEGAFGQTTTDVLVSFGRGKLAPVPGMAVDLLSRRTIVGEKIKFQTGNEGYKEVNIGRYAKEHLLPLNFTGLQEALKDQGAKAWFTVGVPSTFGIGTQTFDNQKRPKKSKIKYSY